MDTMNFARLSKSSLVQLIGVMQNTYAYKDILQTSKIQILSEHCVNCPHYAMSANICDCEHFCDQCKNCPNYNSENVHQSGKVKIYNSEKRKFGNKSKQGISAVKVWTTLNFMHPSSGGILKVSIQDIVAITGLNRRQVKYALKRLQEEQYISYSSVSKKWTDEFMLMIHDYSKMHLPAKKGGTGYITLSSTNLSEILGFKNINNLRTYIRLYLGCDETVVKKQDISEAKTKITKKTVKPWLPAYQTFSNIDALIQDMKKYFELDQKSDDSENIENIIVSLPLDKYARFSYSDKLQQAQENVSDLFDEINQLVRYDADEKTRYKDIAKMANMGILKGSNENWKNKFVVFFEKHTLIDLARLSIEYGFKRVKRAICDIVKKYHFENKQILSWAALARRIIQFDLSFE